MQLRAATEPTDANFVRVVRKRLVNQGCHKRFYRHIFFWIILLPFETSGTASCGPTGTVTVIVSGFFCGTRFGDSSEMVGDNLAGPSYWLIG